MFRKLIKSIIIPSKYNSISCVGLKFCHTSSEPIGQNGNRNAFKQNGETKEQKLSAVLKRAIPGITYISVQDISGGCGAMFEINVEAREFAGLSRVKQHRLVTESLKDEIAEMHGIRIYTTPTQSEEK